MAITLVTGVPGAGKTLFAINEIYKQVLKNNDPKTPAEEKRPIFSDIDGINFGEGEVYVVDRDHDWRQCPDGSLIVYDEAHKRWEATGQSGRSKDDTARDLDEHRHRGFDFIVISQYPTKIHFEVRTNVTRHVHVKRPAGVKAAQLFIWDSQQSNPDDFHAKQSADTEKFIYPKKLFQYYKSATIHTHKLRIPKKLIAFAVFAALPLSYAGYNLLTKDTFFTSGLTPSKPQQAQERLAVAPASPPPVQPESVYIEKVEKPKVVQLLLGCIADATDCICYTDDGQVLYQSPQQCRATLDRPLPFPLKLEEGKRQS